MKSTISTAVGFASLISTVAGHGFITSPNPRMPGTAMKTACGNQVQVNQASDNYGNIQGELQVASSQSDYDAAACDIWLCKGYKFDDNTANVQTYSAGQVVPIKVDIRAPHDGTANVSVVKTSSNTVIGQPLISWDVYGSTKTSIPANQTSFDITIPSDLGSECSTAGDCVIQWWWDARSIDQTYESCIDFTVGDSGSSSGSSSSTPASSSAAAASTSKAAASTTIATSATPTATQVQVKASSTLSAVPTATSASATTGSSGLPEEFTLSTFISWLQTKASSSSSTKARRHARDF
ncbi:chitin binding domain-containing protein [Whalleya microplaca]|nr:chitin binding domain-containing protein [Whalleya microplaca]